VTDQCAGCGFVYDLSQFAAVERGIWERVGEVVAILRARDIDLRSRRWPGVWSPLEYGCHLRDMLLVQRERVLAARRVDRPDCPPSGRDERVVHDGYAEQEPADVARQLADAAQLFSNVPRPTGRQRLGPHGDLPLPGHSRTVVALGRDTYDA
jgi:hypothetical protein